MGEILFDNLSVAQVFVGTECFNKDNVYIQNYIYSLVLWDKIICVQHRGKGGRSVRIVITLQEQMDELNTNYINNK